MLMKGTFYSSYQYGPDTYLLQVKDPDFPARLREYLNVAKQTSAEFQDVKVGSSKISEHSPVRWQPLDISSGRQHQAKVRAVRKGLIMP